MARCGRGRVAFPLPRPLVPLLLSLPSCCGSIHIPCAALCQHLVPRTDNSLLCHLACRVVLLFGHTGRWDPPCFASGSCPRNRRTPAKAVTSRGRSQAPQHDSRNNGGHAGRWTGARTDRTGAGSRTGTPHVAACNLRRCCPPNPKPVASLSAHRLCSCRKNQNPRVFGNSRKRNSTVFCSRCKKVRTAAKALTAAPTPHETGPGTQSRAPAHPIQLGPRHTPRTA